MIPIAPAERVWIATGHTDKRRGMNSLALLVQESLQARPARRRPLCVPRHLDHDRTSSLQKGFARLIGATSRCSSTGSAGRKTLSYIARASRVRRSRSRSDFEMNRITSPIFVSRCCLPRSDFGMNRTTSPIFVSRCCLLMRTIPQPMPLRVGQSDLANCADGHVNSGVRPSVFAIADVSGRVELGGFRAAPASYFQRVA
jgi:hypothetical protein